MKLPAFFYYHILPAFLSPVWLYNYGKDGDSMDDEEKRMEKLLKEDLQKDADRIIKEVEADESLQDIALPVDMDSELKKKIEEYSP